MAGIHRLLAEVDALADADVVVVVAGMEGALASVVGGLTGAPVVAVPTSVGYGAGLEGVTALLGDARLVRRRAHRGRHRQRLRRRLRRARLLGCVADAEHDSATIAWFHCFSGHRRRHGPRRRWSTPAPTSTRCASCCGACRSSGWALEAEPVLRCGIAATKVHVHAEETTVVRTAPHIAALVEEARLPDRVRQRALGHLRTRSPTAEGRLHRRPPEQVHFHEVGGLDAIVDVVGTCAALEVLGVDEVRASSPVATGHRHGPRRPRAAAQPGAGGGRAAGRGAPTHGIDVGVELTTPTGAGLLAALGRSASGRCRP